MLYKLQDCYLSVYAHFKDINEHTWPNYGELWKPITNWSVRLKFWFKRYFDADRGGGDSRLEQISDQGTSINTS